jgi:hypothetical protein
MSFTNYFARSTCLALVAVCVAAAAQTQAQQAKIYRCGADGRDLRDSPCPVGSQASAAQIIFDQPSQAQSRGAREQMSKDAKLGRELEQDRQKQEADARRHAGPAIGINGLPALPKPASAATPVKTKQPHAHKPAHAASASHAASSAR